MRKPILYVTIGLPASGKSTFLATQKSVIVYSADAVRGEWFGDEGLQYTDAFIRKQRRNPSKLNARQKQRIAGPLVWEEVYRRAEQSLAEGHDCALDGINASKWVRKMIIDRFRQYARICGIWFRADMERCIERDASRTRTVGESVLRRIAERFEEPRIEEGFDALEERDETGKLLRRQTNESFKDGELPD